MATTETHRPIRALELRYVLTWYLHELGPLSVAGLASLLDGDRLFVHGRPSKEISDALRWEVRRGRVIRIGRGRYAPGTRPTRYGTSNSSPSRGHSRRTAHIRAGLLSPGTRGMGPEAAA